MKISIKSLIINFLLVISVLLGLLLYALLQVQLWWPSLNGYTSKSYKQQLFCKKVFWSNFLELTLLDCTDEQHLLKGEKFSFNLIDGHLKAQNLSLRLIKSNGKGPKKFPSIPSFIRQIELSNLQLEPEVKVLELLPSHIDYLHMQRSFLVLQDVWKLNSYTNKQFKLNGKIGQEVDLNFELQDYLLKSQKLSLKLNGKIYAKTKDLFKQPFTLTADGLKIYDQSSRKTIPNLSINGQVEFDKDFAVITDWKNISIESNGLKLKTDPANNHLVKLERISISELSPFLALFGQSLQSRNFALNDGYLAAEFLLDDKSFEKSSASIFFDSLSASVNSASKQTIKFVGLKGKVIFIPSKLVQLSSSKVAFSKALSNGQVQPILSLLGIQELSLVFPSSSISNLSLQSSNQQVLSGRGNLRGSLNYFRGKNLEGNFTVNDLQLESDNPRLRLHRGLATIDILNDSLKLDSTIYNASNGQSEKIFINATLNNFLNPSGQVNLLMPQLTVQQKNPSKELALVEGQISDLKFLASYTKNKLSINSLSGQIPHVILKPTAENTKDIILSNGIFNLNAKGDFQLSKLSLLTSDGDVQLNLLVPSLASQQVKAFQNAQLTIKGQSSFAAIDDLLQAVAPNLKIIQSPNHALAGKLDIDVELTPNNIKKFDLRLRDTAFNYQGNSLISSFNGRLKLHKNNELRLDKVEGTFNGENRFSITAHLPNPMLYYHPLAPLSGGTQKEGQGPLPDTRMDINVFVNPKNLSDFLVSNKIISEPSVHFDKGVYIPLSLSLQPKDANSFDFKFSSNFHKMQLFNGNIHLSQELSKLENITGAGNLNLRNKQFKINDLFYSGKDFGVIVNAQGEPKTFDFYIESSPLLDLSEIATLWSDEYASGQFRGKIVSKGFSPGDKSTWIKNMQAEMYSEEDVHDIEYGILYGKHFRFNLNTNDGNGLITLTTRKGKIKNLQISNLKSEVEIKDGLMAYLKDCSLDTADGQASVRGQIDMTSGQSEFIGGMKDVNIETISNNLFGNQGDYNGKGNLNYDFSGNFIDLLRSAPPEKASGDFELSNGVLKQVAELSKGLNLANLIFGLPIYFSFSTISHILQPQQDAAFYSIKGEWYFSNELKKIFLKDITYTGKNALHLSLNGDWDFRRKDVDFDVYGFFPKRAQLLKLKKGVVNTSNSSILDLSDKSRHFTFQVKGNMNNPNSLKDSVKKSLRFKWFAGHQEVKKRFLKK